MASVVLIKRTRLSIIFRTWITSFPPCGQGGRRHMMVVKVTFGDGSQCMMVVVMV